MRLKKPLVMLAAAVAPAAGTGTAVAWVEQVSGNEIRIAEMDFEGRYQESRRTVVPERGIRHA